MSVDDVGLIERCFEYGGVPGERERERKEKGRQLVTAGGREPLVHPPRKAKVGLFVYLMYITMSGR